MISSHLFYRVSHFVLLTNHFLLVWLIKVNWSIKSCFQLSLTSGWRYQGEEFSKSIWSLPDHCAGPSPPSSVSSKCNLLTAVDKKISMWIVLWKWYNSLSLNLEPGLNASCAQAVLDEVVQEVRFQGCNLHLFIYLIKKWIQCKEWHLRITSSVYPTFFLCCSFANMDSVFREV